jgi:hypothetical protein
VAERDGGVLFNAEMVRGVGCIDNSGSILVLVSFLGRSRAAMLIYVSLENKDDLTFKFYMLIWKSRLHILSSRLASMCDIRKLFPLFSAGCCSLLPLQLHTSLTATVARRIQSVLTNCGRLSLQVSWKSVDTLHICGKPQSYYFVRHDNRCGMRLPY